GRGHLAEVEEDRHERARLHGVAGQRLDLVGEIGDRCAAAHADRLPVAAGDLDATYDRGIPHLEFLPLRPTRLALLGLATSLSEGACGTAAGATATATAAGTTCEAAARTCAWTARTAAGTTGTAGPLLERCAGATALTAARSAGTRGPGPGCAGTRGAGTRRLRARDVPGRGTLPHALRGCERVVPRARAGGALPHALRGGEGVVAGARSAGLRRGLVRARCRLVSRASGGRGRRRGRCGCFRCRRRRCLLRRGRLRLGDGLGARLRAGGRRLGGGLRRCGFRRGLV